MVKSIKLNLSTKIELGNRGLYTFDCSAISLSTINIIESSIFLNLYIISFIELFNKYIAFDLF